ncbi:COPB2, partial [Symbiodinium sp. KB8]
VAIGFDEGCVLVKLGSDRPICSMEKNGRLMYAVNNTVMGGSVRSALKAGQLVALADEESIFVLRFDQDAVNAARQGGEGTPGVSKDLGVEAAFDVEYSVEERVRSGIWVGACYLYVSHSWRLNYVVGGEVVTVAHLDRPMYLLGYLPKEGVAVLMDKSKSVVTYPLTLSILDPDMRFDLALQLDKLETAFELMRDVIAPSDAGDADSKWKQLADLALAKSDLKLAKECQEAVGDASGLLLLYAATGNPDGMRRLADMAAKQGRANIEFICRFLTADVEGAIEVLKKADRLPEVAAIVQEWKAKTAKVNARLAEGIADPERYPNMFPGFDIALKAEQMY